MAEAKGERMLLLAFNGCVKVVTYWLARLLDPQFKVALEKFQQKLCRKYELDGQLDKLRCNRESLLPDQLLSALI